MAVSYPTLDGSDDAKIVTSLLSHSQIDRLSESGELAKLNYLIIFIVAPYSQLTARVLVGRIEICRNLFGFQTKSTLNTVFPI